jgi:hypothetical protein
MLDVHPPHFPTRTWRDFFIHVATICVGLLIAVAIEQTVELIHHRHQVAEAREALRVERGLNIRLFALQTAEFQRDTPALLTNIAIFRYLRRHPHAPPQKWPGEFNWLAVYSGYSSAAYDTAKTNGVLAYMPRPEVQILDELYRRLSSLEDAELAARAAIIQARAFYVIQPDPSQLTPAQLDLYTERMTQVVLRKADSANQQRNLFEHFPDFKPAPTFAEISLLTGVYYTRQQYAAAQAIVNQLKAVTDKAARTKKK